MSTISVEHFTDPGCPFAFSAEPRLLALQWRYGDQLSWTTRMVVLSESADEYAAKGLTPEIAQVGARTLRDAHGMPIDDTLRPLAATVHACRAFVAARQYAPERAGLLLRRLRVLAMDGGVLDDPTLIAQAVAEAGIDAADMEAWLRDPDVTVALRADMAAARDPLPAALAQNHKLAPAGDGRRYTCPSVVFTAPDGTTAVVAGFQATETYETVLANLVPDLERREPPASVDELLAWSPFPLATAEIAEIMQISAAKAREQAATVADEHPAGQDAYWSAPAALALTA